MPYLDTATLSSVTPSGTPTNTLTLTFDKAISGLSASDITLTGVAVTKGNLSGSGPTYTLAVDAPPYASGTLNVAVAKQGYEVIGSPKTVTIIGAASTPLVADQWANGNITDAAGIDWYSINVTTETTYRVWWNETGSYGNGAKTAQVVVGAWRADGTNIFGNSNTTVDTGWTTAQTFTSTTDSTVYVRVRPYNALVANIGTYGIVYGTDTTRPIIDTVTLNSVGFVGSTTPALTLTFDKEVPGLSANDITLSGITGVTKGTVGGTGPTYTMTIDSPPWANGTLDVAVAKAGYTINGSPKTVAITGATPTPLVADKWAEGDLLVGTSVHWYSLTVTNGTMYRFWWNERGSNGDGSKTADVDVIGYYSDGSAITGWTSTVDGAWSQTSSKYFTATEGKTAAFVRVRPYGGTNDNNAGTYGIVYTTGTTRPY
jgi:hypothetical protein